jgi:type IV fimbrial biogenesis protein FimT
MNSATDCRENEAGGLLRLAATGFTLFELLITLTIVAVLSSLAIPSFSQFREKRVADTTIARVAQAVTAARSSAINHNSLVTLCRSQNAEVCGGSWEQGMLIFTDENGDRELNGEDRVVRYLSFPEAEGSLSWRAFGRRQYIQFTSLRTMRKQNGSFTYCPYNRKLEYARQLILNRSARARFAQDENGDGIVDTASGRALPC